MELCQPAGLQSRLDRRQAVHLVIPAQAGVSVARGQRPDLGRHGFRRRAFHRDTIR